MDLFTGDSFFLLLLVLMRMTGAIFFNPILGRKNIPSMMKTGLVMLFSLIIVQTNGEIAIEASLNLLFIIALIKEVFVGFLIGYSMQIFEMVFTYAGTVIDSQMGLAMANVYDPQSGAQVSITGTIFQYFYLLTFFALDGHLTLIQLIIKTGEFIPYGSVNLGVKPLFLLLEMFVYAITLMVKLAMPIIAYEFLTEISIGILMRMIPQINIFVLSIQIRIIIGIFMLLLLANPIAEYFQLVVDEVLYAIGRLMQAM